MNDIPIISVIVPCYNQGMFVAETLESVMAQTYHSWEVVIVDDGSTDDSRKVIDKYLKKDSRIRYYYQENGGVSKARNIAVKYSKGKYILPLDSDDKIAPTYLEKAVSYMEYHPECVLFYCHANLFGEKTEPWIIEYKDYKSLLLHNCIFCSSVFRKADFYRVGGYDETFRTGFEDWEFYIRLLYGNGKVYQDPEVLFHYRQHNNISKSRTIEANQKEEEIFQVIYDKNKDKYHQFFPNDLVSLRKITKEIESLKFDKNLLEATQRENKVLNETIAHLLSELSNMHSREKLYLSYTLVKVIYKIIRAYRKHILKEIIY